MEITGIIHKIFETQQVTATFQKRAFVIRQDNVGNDGNPYPEFISLEFIKDKVDMINSYQVGQEVEVLYNLKGREWQSPQGELKYFNTLQAWKIHSSKGEPEQPPAPAANNVPNAAPILAAVNMGEAPVHLLDNSQKTEAQEPIDQIPF